MSDEQVVEDAMVVGDPYGDAGQAFDRILADRDSLRAALEDAKDLLRTWGEVYYMDGGPVSANTSAFLRTSSEKEKA